MFIIDEFGIIEHLRIEQKRFLGIEKDDIEKVEQVDQVYQINGIIVHQTDSPSAQSTFNSYATGYNGAHFLIDYDGTIYQTASIYKKTYHVGQMRSRCIVEHSCDPSETEQYNKLKWRDRVKYGRVEAQKPFPRRYPSNADSIGIEIVGKANPGPDNPGKDPVFETVTEQQNASLAWLIAGLTDALNISLTEIYRHPDVAFKNTSEARSAQW